MNSENLINIPDRVHFDRGFGYKYQYLLSTLMIKLIQDTKSISAKYEFKKRLHDELLIYISQQNHSINLDNTLKNILSIIDFSKANYNKNVILMLEGDNKYFEDINIFNNISNDSHIVFLQVKGNDANNSNITSIIKKAMFNFIENENIENINSFKFLVMTNKEVQSYFYNKTIDDKKKLVDFCINNLEEIITIQNTTQKSKVKKLLLREIAKNLSKKTFFINNLDYCQIDKRLSFFKNLDILFYKKLNKIILLILNMKVIDFIDYKIIIYLLNMICNKDEFLNLLWKVELLSMNRKDILERDLKERVKSINFNPDIVKNIRFSDKPLVKYGKIF